MPETASGHRVVELDPALLPISGKRGLFGGSAPSRVKKPHLGAVGDAGLDAEGATDAARRALEAAKIIRSSRQPRPETERERAASDNSAMTRAMSAKALILWARGKRDDDDDARSSQSMPLTRQPSA